MSDWENHEVLRPLSVTDSSDLPEEFGRGTSTETRDYVRWGDGVNERPTAREDDRVLPLPREGL